MMKKLGKIVTLAVAAYTAYFVGVDIVYPKWKMKQLAKQKSMEQHNALPITETDERATVRFDCHEAMALRCELIDQAQESIDFTQYSIFDDESGDLFIQHLLRAADRGVKVRLILPGMIMKWRGKSAFKKNAVASHPNITLRLWGGIDLCRPWRMNNVLHDKIFIVDHQKFISAGRNVGNRFMFAKSPDEQTYDLDLVVDSSHADTSLLDWVQVYFDTLWNSDEVHEVQPHLLFADRDRARLMATEAELNHRYASTLKQEVWKNLPFVPMKRCGFIHNPLIGKVKTPFIWEQLTELVKESKQARLQTPYLVLTAEMRSYMQQWSTSKVELLTNSLASTPNALAFSGYLSQKKHDLQEMHIQEYQGRGSVHNKAFVLDQRITGVGSFNMDPRSAYLNTENMVVVDSPLLAEQMNHIMDHFERESLTCRTATTYQPKQGVVQRRVAVGKRCLLKAVGVLTKGVRHLT